MKRRLSLITATLAALAALIVSGCTSLTAPAPLFTAADQVGPPALSEGIWIGVDEHCPARNATHRNGRFPRGCEAFEIRRGDDGLWRITGRPDLMTQPRGQEGENNTYVLALAPVSEHTAPEAYAAYYVAEVREEDGSVVYAGMVPVGTMPATSFVTVSIDCSTVLRDGPIDGITATYGDRRTEVDPGNGDAPTVRTERVLNGCIAASHAAVREAARRALVEGASGLLEQAARFVYVRPH